MKFVCSLFFFLLAGFSYGGVTFQLDARKHVSVEGNTNLVWQSLQGMTVTGASATWKKIDNQIINVVGAEAGPLVFEEVETYAEVRTVFMVVKCGETLRMRETLICGGRVFRFSGMPENEPEGNLTAEVERGGYCETTWAVDGVPFGVFEAGKTHLVEVVFPVGMPLSRMGLGGDTGRSEWRRGFGNGGSGFLEVVAYDNVPDSDVMAGTRHYLDRKHRLGLGLKSTEKQRIFAQNDGLSLGSTFATIFMVK